MFFLYQAFLPTNYNSIPTGVDITNKETGLFSNPIITLIFYLALFLFVVALIISIIKQIIRKQNRIPLSLQKVVLLVTVPKEISKDEKEQTRDIKEVIAQAETLFLNLGGIKPYKYANVLVNTWNNFWYGRADHIALEIIAKNGLIMFYLAVPRHLQQLVELQINAQYPKAHIEEVQDYNIFTPQGKIFGGYLKLSKKYIFPIRTYKKLDSDPLNAITNTLSKLKEDEGAAIQILIRPAPAGWRKFSERIAQSMQKGKTLPEAMKTVTQGVTGAIFSSLKSPKKNDPYSGQSFNPRFLTPMEQELVKSLEEKASKAGFHTNIRIVTSSPSLEQARSNFLNIVNAFSQYTAQESGNSFIKKPLIRKARFVNDFIYRHFSESQRILLNTEEITSIFHLPLPTTETPNILWLLARKAPCPTNVPKEGITLGKNIYRGVETLIKMKRDDRRRHVYTIGMTGTGKSVLMCEMAKQDIRNGEGVCVVDPHGGLVEDILGSIPKERMEDVIIFDPSDVERPVGLNMLEANTPEEADFAIQEMIAIFYKLFPPEMIGPMFEHNMRNVMLTLIEDKEYPGTIADIPRMFTDKTYQDYKLKKVRDPMVRSFWEKEMAKTSDFHKSEMLGYLISKVGRFVENQMMRNIIGQPRSGFNFRKIMDKQKILLVNLSKGKTGEVNSNLLGLIIVSKLQMAALARANMPESERKDFYLYIDEFQNFITDSIATILSEARKYKLNLTMAHQYLGQLVTGNDTKLRDAVLGTVGTLIAFRIGVEDAEIIAKQFVPVFSEYDVINIARFNAYVKLLIDNATSKAFNMATFPPSPSEQKVANAIKEYSRMKYGRSRQEVEMEILERTKLGEPIKTQGFPIGEKSI